MTRPRDPEVRGETLTFMPIPSHEAVRRILDLAFRDALTVLDLTYGAGRFWREPLPPGISLVTNDLDPSRGATHRLDFTDMDGFNDDGFDVVVFDPPHVADGGAGGIMGTRYGTVKTTEALRLLVSEGMAEALRLARVGVIAKVTDAAHGGEMVLLSDEVRSAAAVGLADSMPYLVLHTYRPTFLRDGKWTRQRVPRSNGATYYAWRKDSNRHRDFPT